MGIFSHALSNWPTFKQLSKVKSSPSSQSTSSEHAILPQTPPKQVSTQSSNNWGAVESEQELKRVPGLLQVKVW